MEVKQHSPNNQRIKEEIKGKIRKFLETNENGSTIYQSLQDAAKAVQEGRS